MFETITITPFDFALVLIYGGLARAFDGLMDDWRDRFYAKSRIWSFIVTHLTLPKLFSDPIGRFIAGTKGTVDNQPYRIFGIVFDVWHCLKYIREFFICAMISPFLGWWAVLVIYSVGAAVFVIVYHGLEKR